MSTTEILQTIWVYFKIPFTEITALFKLQDNLPMNELFEYVNTDIRNNLNINTKYDIQLVETGQPNEELAYNITTYRYEQTLREIYDSNNNYNNNTISFYVRPIHHITREFVRQNDYSS